MSLCLSISDNLVSLRFYAYLSSVYAAVISNIKPYLSPSQSAMASAKTAASPAAPHLLNPNSTQAALSKTPPQEKSKPNDIVAEFNYYKDPGDGSPPAPAIIGKPETYDRPEEHVRMVVHDVRGEEDKLSLDATGFQICKHVSAEKDFRDEDQVKRVYYPEIEAMIKEM